MVCNLRVCVSFPAFSSPLGSLVLQTGLGRRPATSGSCFRLVFALPVLAVGMALTPGAARAQVIDQYLDSGIPGYGISPGVTVATREHPEYDPDGVRVGQFVLLPTLEESLGYDDNVTGTSTPHGSPVIETNAKVSALDQMSDGSLGASVSVDNAEYPSQTAQSYTNWTAALGGSYDFGRDVLTLAATHLNLNQTPRDLDAPQLNSPIAYTVDDIRAAYKIDMGHLNIEPDFDVSWFNFNNGQVLGTPYLQNYRDRISYMPGVTANYEFATRRSLVLIVRDTNSQFANPVPGIPRQNYNDISVLGGVSYDLNGALSFRLLGGYEQRNFQSHLYQTIEAPIVEGSATWTPTGLTTVTGTAARYVENSSAETTIGYTETALKLNVDHELYRNILLRANGNVFLDDYAQNGGNQEFYTAGVGATWLVNRQIRVLADYTYSTRHTSNAAVFNPLLTEDGIFGQDYSENLFLVRLRFAL